METADLAVHGARGALFVVATPIGNLDDLSGRAQAVLRDADTLLVEDTRRTRTLLDRFAISTPATPFHEHNERSETPRIIARMLKGTRFALVSDAGTPLVSDPGYFLVHSARTQDVPVFCIPGPSAVTAALSVSGLPTDRFTFEGFLPARQSQRMRALAALAAETRTMVFYEAPHRIARTLRDLCAAFGGEREAALARELTKRFESVVRGRLDSLLADTECERIPARGEIVLIVRGSVPAARDDGAADAILEAMLDERVALRQAAAVAARVTGLSRNALYRRALSLAANRPAR